MLHTALLSVLLFQSAPGNLTHKEYTEKLVKITATGTVEELKAAIDNGKIFERDRIFDACGLAAKTGRVEIVKFYLENKMVKIDEFIPNTREHQSWTMGDMLIHHAASAPKGNIEMLKLLLEKGADINAKTQNASARTALYFAATKNNEEMFDFLLANKAHADNHLFSDLVAISQKSMNLNKYLKKLLHQASINSNWDTLKFLLDHGANINAKDIHGKTPLHHLVESRNYKRDDILKNLLKLGPKIDEVDENGDQAIHLAASKGNSTCCTILIKNGADIRAKNRNGVEMIDLVKEKNSRDNYLRLFESYKKRSPAPPMKITPAK